MRYGRLISNDGSYYIGHLSKTGKTEGNTVYPDGTKVHHDKNEKKKEESKEINQLNDEKKVKRLRNSPSEENSVSTPKPRTLNKFHR